MQTKVDKIVPQEDNPNLAGGVIVNGETLPADFVIMGVGVAPATEFLKESGIELERDGSVKVNEYLRLATGKDTRNVYAIGAFHNSIDPHALTCCRRHCKLPASRHRGVRPHRALECMCRHERRRCLCSRLWFEQVAGNHGRAVGKTIAGSPQPFVKVPVFWSARAFSSFFPSPGVADPKHHRGPTAPLLRLGQRI